MSATVSLESLWNFIESLSLNTKNKEWLAHKLLNEVKDESDKKESYEDFVWRMCGALKNDPRSTQEIKDEIRNSRQFGITRHILPLDE